MWSLAHPAPGRRSVRRKAVGILTAAAMLGSIAACGSGNESSNTGSGGSGGGGGGKTVKFRMTDSNLKPAMEEIAAKFEKEKGIKVVVEVTPWTDYWTKITTEMTSGKAPDVMEMYASRFLDFQNHLADVSSANVDMNNYNAADALVKDGKPYGLPFAHNTNALLYNKKLLDAAGVKAEQLTWDPQTGGSLLEAAKKLTKGDTYGFPVWNNDQDLYLNMVAGNGSWVMDEKSEKFRYDAPENLAVLQFLSDLINKHKVTPPPSQVASSSAKVVELFKGGKLALFPSNSGRLNDISKATSVEWGILPYPKGPAGDVTIVGNVYAAVYKRSKNQDAALEWAKYLSGPEGQNLLGKQRIVRPALKSAEAEWAAAWKAKGLDVTPYVDPAFKQQPLPITKGYVSAKQKIDAGFVEIYLGNQTPAEGAKKITADAQKLRDAAR